MFLLNRKIKFINGRYSTLEGTQIDNITVPINCMKKVYINIIVLHNIAHGFRYIYLKLMEAPGHCVSIGGIIVCIIFLNWSNQ